MKKRKLGMLSVVLATVVSVSAFGGCGGGDDSSVRDDNGIVYTNFDAMLPETVAETGTNIVENGTTEYKIVIPAAADTILRFASAELQDFIKASTNVEIPIVTDDGATFDENNKYISLGSTSVFGETGLTFDKKMGETGYYMKRYGNTLVIAAKNSNGTLSAVYDFLNYATGLEIYAADELDYESKTTIPLLDFDVRFIPVVDMRKMLAESFDANDVYTKRMRLWSWLGSGEWITFAHTTVSNFLPVSEYGDAHPDWYAESGTQVCYANEGMRLEMEEQIKDRIKGSPEGFYVMIGHEDDKTMCNCTACQEERALMGGYGGQELNFTSKVAEELGPWLEENCPDRDIKFVFFAYQTSEEPPIKYDAATDTWTPVWKDYVINERVKVMCAPVYVDFSQWLTSSENSAYYLNMKGWSELFKQAGIEDGICIWTYSTSAHSYFATINNFATPGEHYRVFAELGADYVMDQGVADSCLPVMEALKLYTMSKMFYRRDYDYNEMVEDFIEHYYGVAADEMKEYYGFIRTRYKYLNENESFTGRIFSDTTLPAYWPRATVLEMMDIIDRGLAKVETIKNSDPARYEVLHDRLKREKLSPIYLMFTHYMSYLSQSEKEEYWNDMNTYTQKFNIIGTRESANNMLSVIEGWKTQIFG